MNRGRVLRHVAFAVFAVTMAMSAVSANEVSNTRWGIDAQTGIQLGLVTSDPDTITAASWDGPAVDGKAEGMGQFKITFISGGSEYTWEGSGEMKAGILDGKVKLRSSSGMTYEGDFKAGIKDGKGTGHSPNGDSFEGDWKNGMPDGVGKMIGVDGSVYEGDLRNGQSNGKGVLHKNGDIYDGDWKNGDFDGYGVHVYANGDRYEGQFVKWWADGKGKKTFKTNYGICVYDGDWKHGQFDGQGLYRWPNGETYEGGFKNGQQNGHGVKKDATGKVTYDGEYIGGLEAKHERIQ